MKPEFSMEIFKKFTKYFSLSYFVLRDRDRTHIWIEFQNFGTPLQMRCTSTEDLKIYDLLTDSVADNTLLSVRLTQLNTRSIGWQKCVGIGKSRFQISRWISIILNFIEVLSGIIPYYVTSPTFLTPSNYYELQNAKWSDEYRVRKINPDIHLMCELHVTVKAYRAECILSDADSHFFPNQRDSCLCSLFISLTLHKYTVYRY